MKLILSRKGFDGGAKSGRGPSPIFPDDTLFSLPIPSGDDITYGELRHYSERLGEVNIGEVVADLTSGRRPDNQIGARHRAHLDPHVNIKTYPKIANSEHAKNWRGLFGQIDIAQDHLRINKVGAGDLFLFFGLYRRVNEPSNGRGWRFDPDAPRQHILWGWLQVDEVRTVSEVGEKELLWARYHSHMNFANPNNTIYVGREKLDIGDGAIASGAGVFPKLDDRLVLTEPGQSVTRWKLPRWFYPDNGKPALTYHDPKRTKSNRWTRKEGDSEHVYLRSVGRGQEFVLNLDEYPEDEYREAVGWARDLIRDLGAR